MPDYLRNYGTPSAQLRGEFFMDTERDGMASAKNGRDIFRSIERVRIVIPGATVSIVVKNVDDTHRERWPEAYAAFKRGQEAPLEGLPLEEWPILNKAQVAELRYLQIRTVEELATLSDLAVQRIGMGGRVLREQAQGYLDDATREAHNAKLVAENDRLNSRIATLESQVEALGAHVLQLSQAAQHYRDTPPPLQSFVPGSVDPFEIAKAAGAPEGAGPGSSLDALGGSRRRRHGVQPAGGPPPLPEAAAAADEAA